MFIILVEDEIKRDSPDSPSSSTDIQDTIDLVLQETAAIHMGKSISRGTYLIF